MGKKGVRREGGSKGGSKRQRSMTNQFIFVEKLDKRGRNEGVESLQEGIYLRLDGSRHPQLCH